MEYMNLSENDSEEITIYLFQKINNLHHLVDE